MARKRHRLAQRRKAVGLSQERLAEVMRVDRSTVVRWERADTDPQPWRRPRLAAALKVSVEELAELLADVGEAPSRPSERLDYVLNHPGGVDLIAVAYLRERLRLLDEQYDRVPSTLLLADAGQLHGQTVYLRGRATSGRVRRELLAAEIESATLMGQLVWDASQRRDHTAAISYFDQAIGAAQQIRDVASQARAQLRKSYVALYGTANPRVGLSLAHRAAVAAQHDSHVIAGLALLHVGEAHAMLDEARQVLNDGKKSTAIVLGNLALAGIRQRDIDAAVVRLHEAIDVVEHTRGGGGLNVVFTAARELRPWRNERAVQEVNDRLLMLMTAA